jgi:tetratricopeptide (TPR) repeat protein
MARRIHPTRRTLREPGRQRSSSPKEKREAVEEAGAALGRKQQIQRLVKAERNCAKPPLAGTAGKTIRIAVRDECELVHHGASPQDIRAILAVLPSAATAGIARIQLAQGKQYMDERADDAGENCDPFTRRPSCEVFPGVFGGKVVGTYDGRSGIIWIYAYVYDPARLPLPRTLCEFYLRLHALKTLVHEVAHHHDHVARLARGRRRSDRRPANEWYAEKMEHTWTRTLVLPYLQRTYPKEARALRKWVAHRGGLLVGLEFFAGDARRTERNGWERLVFSTAGAFESWVGELPHCRSLGESRLALARELHSADAYRDCLTILDAVLAKEPESIPALACKADTLVHLERPDEALALAEHVLRSAPGHSAAWRIRGDVLEGRKDWAKLLLNSAAWQRSPRLKRAAARILHLHRAVACCVLGDDAGLAASVEAHLALIAFRNKDGSSKRRLSVMRNVRRRAGKGSVLDIDK